MKFKEVNKSLIENDWTIPETYDFESLPIKLTEKQLQAIVIMLWKQYMLCDEVLSGISFLQNAPYFVRHSVDTLKALNYTKESIVPTTNDEIFVKYNAPENKTVESGMPLPHTLQNQEGYRFNLIASHLEPNTNLVDFGSFDGCFTNRLGLMGHKVIGIDGCPSSVELANKKAVEFSTTAQHICCYFEDTPNKLPNKFYDCLTTSDTYEHLTDPVKEMFEPAKKLLKDNGKLLLVTPFGPWMRGEYIDYAHPWVYLKEGKSWLHSNKRAHLIAPTVWSVADDLKKSGFYVKNCYVSLCNPYKDVEEQGNIFAEAYLQNKEYRKEVIFCNNSDSNNFEALLAKAKQMVIEGNLVKLYANCTKWSEGIYDGVELHHIDKF